ncbi:MAG: YggS family pyridoxal phosphate-dependent enzyme [Candidatus Neomarinimicrobiota bacterium]|nr:MAG: YggS family pyridoxal phosphate-dependent enzyme [Candidatus Neomarinimicrobiota bacterium]HDN59593.1 YggS family pyridoxal phosphate-dependent enzyme [Candidatus Neomarinimicrobiota bacterium]
MTGGEIFASAQIRENLARVKERIQKALVRAGRENEEVKIVAVSKTKPPELIRYAIESGIKDIGENRVQEAIPKIEAVGKDKVVWHLVGHLQTNKAKKAVCYFDMIQSVDSVKIARKISSYSEEEGKQIPVLVEVNISGESTKFGIAPEKVKDFVGEISCLRGIKVKGLMTIGPLTYDKGAVRRAFRKMFGIFDDLRRDRIEGVEMEILSMGMTDDFEVAVEEGTTMVRIGRAIFGERG